MYHDDHPPAHIHVEYQNYTAMVEIQSGEIIKGFLPKKVIKLLKEWIVAHSDELQKNWDLAKRFEPLEKIVGADND